MSSIRGCFRRDGRNHYAWRIDEHTCWCFGKRGVQGSIAPHDFRFIEIVQLSSTRRGLIMV